MQFQPFPHTPINPKSTLMSVHSDNLLADSLQGCFVVTCTLCAFISLVWLREQIVHGGAPHWLEQNQQQPANPPAPPNEVNERQH